MGRKRASPKKRRAPKQGAPKLAADSPLLHDEAVVQLCRLLALSDRFHFYIAVCRSPRVVHALLDLLVREVAAERDEPVRLVRIDPYDRRDERGAMTFERLAEQVLARLLAPAAHERAPDVLFAVDASRALAEDDEAWNLLFQRMNERRNVIAGALRGPLLLCLPERLEPVFAHAAPDFWSIRSLSALIGTAVDMQEEGELGLSAESLERRMIGLREATESADPAADAAEIEAGLAAAREAVAKAPDDPSAAKALAVWLDRQVDHEMTNGSSERAGKAAHELVALRRQLLANAPNSGQSRRALSLALRRKGWVLETHGDLDGAVTALEDSVELARTLVREEPEREEWLFALASRLFYLANLLRTRRDMIGHRKLNEESLALAQRLVLSEPDNTARLHLLADIQVQRGDTLQEAGDPAGAIGAYEEGLKIRRSLVARAPEDLGRQREVARILDRVGSARGEGTEALAAYQEALDVARNLAERMPKQMDRWRDLAASLFNLAILQRRNDDLDRALAALEEGQQVMRDLLRHDPSRADWWEDVAHLQEQLGRVRLLKNDLPMARDAIDGGLRILRILVGRHPTARAYRDDLARIRLLLAGVEEAEGQLEAALELNREALAEWNAILTPNDPFPGSQRNAEISRQNITRLEERLAARTVRKPKRASKQKH